MEKSSPSFQTSSRHFPVPVFASLCSIAFCPIHCTVILLRPRHYLPSFPFLTPHLITPHLFTHLPPLLYSVPPALSPFVQITLYTLGRLLSVTTASISASPLTPFTQPVIAISSPTPHRFPISLPPRQPRHVLQGQPPKTGLGWAGWWNDFEAHRLNIYS